jgi:hypothetical protein
VYATPGGASLGLVVKGAALASRRVDGQAVELLVDGWIFARSIGATQRDGFDLEVTQAGGQNLRQAAAPAARIIAHLARGVLLQKVEADGHGWVHVRRYAWVPRASLKPAAVVAAKAPASATAASKAPETPAAPGRPDPSPAALPPVAPSVTQTDRALASRPTPLFSAPGGNTMVTLPAGTELRVITRAGDWTQVALTGWVHTADLGNVPDEALVGVSAAQVRSNPSLYVGKMVEWRLQVISVMVADELRPEIPAGRSYLLTRGPLPESGFVYVILPNDQVSRFRQLEPLKELTFRVQVRSAATKYLPNPVVDFLQVVAGS